MDWRVSRRATADMEAIAYYTEERWGLAQALRYVDDIEARFAELARLPKSGRAAADVLSGLRASPLGSHVIYYRETLDGILIVRVLHGRMDTNSQFASDDGAQ